MTTTFHIEIDEEGDYATQFTYLNYSTGLPVDLTGWRADLQVRINYNGESDGTVSLTYTSDTGGGIVLGGTTGTIDVYIPYTDTTGLSWTRAVYNLFLYSPTGMRKKYAKGFFTIIPSANKIVDNALVDISGSEPTPLVQPNNFGVTALNATTPA